MGKKKKAGNQPAAGKKALAALYRHAGYRGPIDPNSAPQPPRRGLRGARPAPPAEGPLTPAKLDQLENEFRKDPDGVTEIVRKSVGKSITKFEVQRMLARTRAAMQEPAAYVRLAGLRAKNLGPCQRPPYVPPIPGIDVDPCRWKFEGARDASGWLINCGPWWLKQKFGSLKTAPKPPHAEYVYPMKDQQDRLLGANDTIRVALFSDWGTGEYHSRYIAHYIEKAGAHYAIHLGDVYYAGIEEEVRDYLAAPLAPILNTSRVFVLNGNHEMLSGGFAYFKYIDDKRSAGAQVPQEQASSYFCLVSDRYQIIALDTAYDWRNDGELTDAQQGAWMRQRLEEGRDANRKNILLTQHEPFGLGERKANPLFDQVKACATRGGKWMVDYWFWGDEHYCARFRTSDQVPFVGSCIGHAGHPVDLGDVKRRMGYGQAFAPEEWVDDSPRFKDFREDELGNAGFCLLELGPAGVKVQYVDWLNHPLKTFQ